MTVRLYYEDSYLREFTAEVVAQRVEQSRHVAILDRTAFYPTSGGQPADTGHLGAARVLNVEEGDSGAILHFLDSPIPNGPVVCRIDWERRFDHMQQHTGQHILSQAFIKAANAPTVSFHLGQENCTIDVGLDQPAPSVIQEAETLACGVVFDDRPVHILAVDRARLAALGVRKESPREGEIRVIDVEGFDRSPCGGTHVRRSGEVGLIVILDWERYKGGTRIEFACGARALRMFRKDHEVLKTLSRLFSGNACELPRLAEKLLEERSSLAREKSRLLTQILEMEALDLVNRADKVSGKLLVRARFEDRTIESVKVLAQKITAHPGVVAILALEQEMGQIVVAKSDDVPGSCGAAVKEAAAQFGGKGGGRPELAQAGGIQLAALAAWCESVTTSLLGASLIGHK